MRFRELRIAFSITCGIACPLLIVLWLSTLTGFSGSEDVRAFIMLGCLITTGVAALSCRAQF